MTFSTTAGPLGDAVKAHPVGCVALLGGDFPGVTFDLRVETGDRVSVGQVLATDRRRPDICFVAPVAGRVGAIKRGARRRLDRLEIGVDGDDARSFAVDGVQDNAGLRALLLASGAWAGFRTRPFGLIPDPNGQPAAIFVTTTDTNPSAADPVTVLAGCLPQFARGVEALLRLTPGTVFICQPPGAPLIAPRDRIKVAHFAGPHPSGLAGTHIHQLLPASRRRPVWQIGYQDVVALGHLLETGQVMGWRDVALSGPGIAEPTLLRVPLGARLADLVMGPGAGILLSGSVVGGQKTSFLRRHDLQVTALGTVAVRASKRPFWHRLMAALPVSKGATILPLESFERAFPFDLLPVPLMRALAVADLETAERLGCLELLEEDMALLSRLCPSRSDYGALLRNTLNALAQEAPQ